MTDNRTTELVSRREATTLLEEFLCGYQNILLSPGINASEAVCKQNELIDEYAERIEQAISATLGSDTLTAEQVMGTFEDHVNMAFPRFVPDWQAIADELNAELGSGTCELVETDCYSNSRETIHVLECSKCGHTCEHVNGSYPRCPHCGAKAVER